MFSILGSVPVINQMEVVKLRGRDQRYHPYHERSEGWSTSLLEPPWLNTGMLPRRARDEGGGGGGGWFLLPLTPTMLSRAIAPAQGWTPHMW